MRALLEALVLYQIGNSSRRTWLKTAVCTVFHGGRHRSVACIFLDTNLEVGYIAADFRLRVAWEASEIVTALTPSDFKP